MALEGTIKDFGLADILQLIGLQRKTGVLTLEDSSVKVTVKFLEGSVVGADTSDRNFEDLLGSVLVRTGRITDAQLRESLRVQKTTLQRLGYILVKQNFISDTDLEDALRIQVTQIVYRLFRWRAGKYHFAAMDLVEYDSEHFKPVSAETILMEGARMIDEWPILERRIKSPTMVFKKTAAGEALDVPLPSLIDADIDFSLEDVAGGGKRDDGELRISTDERDVLHMVDGRARVQDLADMSALAEFDLYRILYELLNRNLIALVEITPAAGIVEHSATRKRVISALLQLVVFAMAGAGLATLRANPFTPWRSAAHSKETELLKTYASRNRLERVEQAVQVFYLDRGAIPETLSELSAAGLLASEDAVDPWGRPYAYSADATAYEIQGLGPDGHPSDLVVRHPFTASQRMVLEGGSSERLGTTRP
jgi:Domain of unknown function (DUF4388)/Type II secretion system (T2SS), protein G